MTRLQTMTATAPSNIAFIKYWGKRDPKLQWPANDSLSMTLSASKTITQATPNNLSHDTFTFAGATLDSRTSPDHKVFRHIETLRAILGVSTHVDVTSRNTFPTGCGIASSASGFAALTIATLAALTGAESFEALNERGFSRERLADLARKGSGSASRSLYGGYVKWRSGDHPESQKITQEFPLNHWPLSDVIVVLSPGEKHVSSSTAHLAAWGSPLFTTRIAGIPERMNALHKAMESRDIELLGTIIEADALEMHAVAMTGEPRVNYFLDATKELLAWTRAGRERGVLPAWFTVDAGPNVHLICQTADAHHVAEQVRKRWPDAKVIMDSTGAGPELKPGRDDEVK